MRKWAWNSLAAFSWAAFFGIVSFPHPGWGQESYPKKPIDLIVSYGPGGGTDASARGVAPFASKKFGVPVNVVNIAGASGVTGTLQALRAAPDGYTLLYDTGALSSLMCAFNPNLPFKLEDRTFVARTMTDYWYLFSNTGTGWKTITDMFRYMKSQPEKFRWSPGAYSATQMFIFPKLFLISGIPMETIKKTKMVLFSKGNAEAMQACVAGDIQFVGGMLADVARMRATGKIWVMATTSPQRTGFYPDIPTTNEEIGRPSDMASWFGISGPKGLPDYVVKKWNDLIREAVRDPEVQASATKSKLTWNYLPDSEFKKFVLREYEDALPIVAALAGKK